MDPGASERQSVSTAGTLEELAGALGIATSYCDAQVARVEEMSLIVVPRRAFRPAFLEGDGRCWGMAVQLYGIRSRRNWGIGDFTDLLQLVRGVARLGGAFVGVNPLHALFPPRPGHASPYSPSNRLFHNPLYIDVEAVEDIRDAAAVPARV